MAIEIATGTMTTALHRHRPRHHHPSDPPAPPPLSSTSRRSPTTPSSSEDAATLLKRQRNTIAARKYRQKKVDRISELESALEDVVRERDELRLKLARQEAETATLKSMIQLSNSSPSSRK
jgi:hypothetical protein